MRSLIRPVGLAVLAFAFLIPRAAAQQETPAYRNPRLPVRLRVADLLQRMTLEEKVDQIAGARHPFQLLDTTGRFTDANAETAFKQLYDLHSTMSPYDSAVLRNAVQRYQVEKTRLGIPRIFFGEGLHGFMEYGSTSFPIPLALGSTFDLGLVRQVFTAVGEEAGSAGVNQVFSPVINIGRDPRWGRTEETFSEDPYLVSQMGVAAIQGLQGTEFWIDRHHVLATAKHFAAYEQSQGGVNLGPANYSERTIREVFLAPFRAAVEQADVGSVMAAYNEIDGIPCHVNHWLLTTELRQRWGFRGYVTSDGGALQMLVDMHHVAADFGGAARQALAAGVDFDLSNGEVYRTLVEQVRDGIVPESELDRAAGSVLAAKFRLGLFDHPYVDPNYTRQITNNAQHKALALKAAQESMVLLKNENNLLPLDLNKLKAIAVIGPDAAGVHLGGYSRDPGPGNQISILDGIRNFVGNRAKVLYAEGCQITTSTQPGWSQWYENNVQLAAPAAQKASIQEAVRTARRADVAILVLGENEGTDREAWSEQHLGDLDTLDLLGAQEELIRAVVATGKPTIVFLINGRPLSINYVAQRVPAILEGWYPGEEGGTAAAQVLFGEVNPGGKLPITFPTSVGQLPDYYNHKPSATRGYEFSGRKPLFPFGYGLSYTTFAFSNLRLESPTIGPGGMAKVSVDVANTGARAGDEVAQLYLHEEVAPVTRPVLQLQGFERVHLNPGEKKTVQFTLTPDQLSLYDLNMHRVVEPGTFDILVGSSSTQTIETKLQVVRK